MRDTVGDGGGSMSCATLRIKVIAASMIASLMKTWWNMDEYGGIILQMEENAMNYFALHAL